MIPWYNTLYNRFVCAKSFYIFCVIIFRFSLNKPFCVNSKAQNTIKEYHILRIVTRYTITMNVSNVLLFGIIRSRLTREQIKNSLYMSPVSSTFHAESTLNSCNLPFSHGYLLPCVEVNNMTST